MTLGRHSSHLPHQAWLWGWLCLQLPTVNVVWGLESAFVIPGGRLEIEEFLEEDSCSPPGPVCPPPSSRLGASHGSDRL